MRLRAGHILGLAALLALLLAWDAARAEGLRRAALIPQWEPQAQFAGYYAARAKGFYAARGVDLEILRGGPASPPSALLTHGRAQFGTLFLSTALRERSEGLKLVNLAQFLRGTTMLLVARRASGVEKPEDLQGRRVSLWEKEYNIQPRAFFRKYRVGVKPLPQGFTVDLFLRGGADAMTAMNYNEYHVLLNAGLDPWELTVFPMRDHGLDYPEDGLYALEDTCRADPDLCRAVAEASIEGWRWVFAHPEEALDLVMVEVRAANLPTNRMHQKWMLERLREAMTPPGGPGPGPLSREEFETMARALKDEGLLANPVRYEDFRVPAP
ncbi:ABC transporter substrate-binding protein [Fundidesulfovibrio magnetotacticus]|nr:ABC transporter substrate-binding protein [Fundidesulfovibrio magnetotacticus]